MRDLLKVTQPGRATAQTLNLLLFRVSLLSDLKVSGDFLIENLSGSRGSDTVPLQAQHCSLLVSSFRAPVSLGTKLF